MQYAYFHCSLLKTNTRIILVHCWGELYCRGQCVVGNWISGYLSWFKDNWHVCFADDLVQWVFAVLSSKCIIFTCTDSQNDLSMNKFKNSNICCWNVILLGLESAKAGMLLGIIMSNQLSDDPFLNANTAGRFNSSL